MRGLWVRLPPLALSITGPSQYRERLTMSPVAEFDLRQTVISNSTFGPNEIKQISQALSADYNNFRTLRDATNELAQQSGRTPAASARLGVAQYLIGRYSDA